MNFKRTEINVLKCNIEKFFFRQTEMEYICFWVTCDGVIIDKNTKNGKYNATYFSKIITSVYRCIELLPRYLVNTLIYVSAFN